MLPTSKGRLLIFDTHPIQYRAPVFAALANSYSDLKVFFFNENFDARRWWFQEVGKTPPQNFQVALREGYSSQILGTARWNLRWRCRRLLAILREENPAAVLIYGYYLPEHWIIWGLCSFRGIPLLFVGESFDWKGSSVRKFFKKILINSFFNRISAFLSIGDKTLEYYRSWGIPDSKIISAHYCTDPKFFEADAESALTLREDFRNRWQISESAFVVLFVGRLFSRKRPQDVIEHHQLVKKDHPELVSVIVGNGEMETQLKEMARGITGIVFTGFLNQADTRMAYYGADLLYLPSEYETWGLVVNEAFACARPAIVTDTCGVAGDLVVAGETGAVVKVGDVKAAVQETKALITHPERLQRFGQAARQKVLAGYTPIDFAESVLRAFQQVVET